MTYLPYLQLAGGFIYLLVGADLLVRGAVAMARKARISPLVVALTVVAFGTSVPELVVSLRAVWTGYPGLVYGNVVGSNIANVLLVASAAAIIWPVSSGGGTIGRDSAIMLGTSVLFLGVCATGALGRGAGLLLLAVLAAVLGVTARETARAHREAKDATPIEWVLGLPSRKRMILLFVGAGALGLPLGARMVVEAAEEITLQFGVSDTVVGLTIIAFSTSLPELATTVVAAVQRRTEVAVGTVVGSNTFNILAIMGMAALVSPMPLPVPPGLLTLDLPVMLVSSAVLCVFVWRRRPIGRTAGLVMVGGYLAYVAVLFLNAGGRG